MEEKLDELQRRVAVLEIDHTRLQAQVQELLERTRPKLSQREQDRARQEQRQAELDREIEDALYEAFEFTPDHGYGLTPDEILSGLERIGLTIDDTPLMQKRAVARVLKAQFNEVKPSRNADGRVYLGIKYRPRAQ